MLSIGFLFKRGKKGRPNRHAKILRDIMRFSLTLEEDNKFSQKELAVWLVSNCNAFEFEPRTPTKNKSYKVLKEINPLLGPLLELGLIHLIGSEREKTGTSEFAVLRFSKAGRLLALIIDSFDPKHKLEDNHKIYEILQLHYSSYKSSKHQFVLHLLTLYHQQDKLNDMTEIIRKVLESVDYIPITDLMDIYEIVTVTYFTDLEKAMSFRNNWETALNTLDLSTKNLFLYDIKLLYEERMANHKDLGDSSLYEDHRFDLRGNPEETALQARCIKCNIVQNLSYRTSNLMIRSLNNKPLDIKCPKCGTDNCMVVPIFTNPYNMLWSVRDTIQLGIIFKKENGKYTNDSLLYQKILSFSLSGVEHQSFIRYAMCKWLKNNHQLYEKRSVESLQSLVARKIEKLIELQLIHEIGSQPISTGTGQTPVYAFDPTSYFLAWLIERSNVDPIHRTNSTNKIFNILCLMLEADMPSSMHIFLKSLIRKTKENDFFMCLVDYMIELLESGSSIKDISDLIHQTFMFRHTDLNLVDKYNGLWEQTLNELEPKVRQLVMFRIKLLYEQQMKERAYDPAEFEKIRFSARKKFDKIILECVCLSRQCQCIRYEIIDLIEYTIRLRYHIKGIPTLEKDCPSCNSTGSMQIIDL